MHIEQSKPPPRVHFNNNKRPRPVLRQPRLAAASAERCLRGASIRPYILHRRAPEHIILPSTCISANKQVAQMKIIKSHRHAPVRKINISCMRTADLRFSIMPREMMRYILYCVYAIARGAGAGPMHSRLDSSRPSVCHSNLQPIRNAFAQALNAERILI
jgi:hypothetical protein